MDVSHALSLVIVLFFLSCLSPVRGNAELRALMELKSSLDPENKLLQTWTLNGDPCDGSFVGIACNEHRKVANVSLQGKGLTGKLSPAVAELKCLSGLYLHYNSLWGEIPEEITNLTELLDLYLNVNNFSGQIPAKIGAMTSLQVVDLCCNQLTGKIPEQMGSLKKLTVLSLQYNNLTGEIPSSLGNLDMLSRLDVSFNDLLGPIPKTLSDIPQLDTLDLRNNSLSGIVPPGLKELSGRFQFENNPGLCGTGFPSLRACSAFDNVNIEQLKQPSPQIGSDKSSLQDIPKTVYFHGHCNQTRCKKSSKLPQVVLISSVITVSITLIGTGFLTFLRYRRRKQKISNTTEVSEGRLSTDLQKDMSVNGASPLTGLGYSKEWDPLGDSRNGAGFSQDHHFLANSSFRFSLEDIESATQCFSESNLMSRSSFSSVFKGNLRDGSLVAIKRINITSCKNEEAEFLKGLNLLISLSHENLVKLRGFCCSRGRGECFLVYDFAHKGKLSDFLEIQDYGSGQVLDWPTRICIIKGIAKGIAFLHGNEPNKPAIVHRNISVEKILLDENFNPLMADSGLHYLLADDFVFSALKTSAAMGYLAPEYITGGRFTEKTDIFAFGVIILQILSGKLMLTNSMRAAAENGENHKGFIDENLQGEFDELQAREMAKIGISCTQEIPNNRPNIETVLQEINYTIGM
ncbi:PREDICTED: probable LRR receptor-like serine/threonine-protein kinase At5g45780 [Tarenaya hassleriana]|uniref:probable LRR receptor-like serine/threonine-protein kinase At5g45780 n=1 Tax=Tarenaya hassleriana TaxID=28532 RepID=UPI00053C2D20|nr:PREDICTED: probable LRR receptor-like serine/threonine-protein kinase At5g45780 [Tarenaya hassleriana]